MATHSSKLWFTSTLNQTAIARIARASEQLGYALPCHVTAVNGAMVTVAFDVTTSLPLPSVTIPKAESPWIRMPTQVGDKGITIPASVDIAQVSGLSNTAPTLDAPPNLTALVFLPVSSQLSPPPVANTAIVQGPQGALIQTTTGTQCQVDVGTSGITLSFGSTSVTIDQSQITLTAGGTSVSVAAGTVTIDGIVFETHVHGGVTSGSASTTGPQP